jgi:hypothetical protein
VGHMRTLKLVSPMSALPPKADIAGDSLDVRFVPESGLMHRSKRPPIRSPCPTSTYATYCTCHDALAFRFAFTQPYVGERGISEHERPANIAACTAP